MWRRANGTGAMVAVIWASIFAALLGAVDEFHQQWIPGRSMELLDWAADFAGGTAGGLFSAIAVSMLPVLLTPKVPPRSHAVKH